MQLIPGRPFFRSLLNVFRSDRLSSDWNEETEFHIAERTADLARSGMAHGDAEHEARRRFGNKTSLRARSRDVRFVGWIDGLATDIKFAVRGLIRSPGFTTVVLLSLTLGIGANTAIFSLINSVVLKTLPVRRPQELLQVAMGEGGDAFSNPLWEEFHKRQNVFRQVLAYSNESFNLASTGQVRRVAGSFVSGEYFGTLGVEAIAGRLLTASDDVRGCPATAVVSSAFAESSLGGARRAVGSAITLDGHPVTVIGVVTSGYFGIDVGRLTHVYVPLCAEAVVRAGRSSLDRRDDWLLTVIARGDGSTATPSYERRLRATAAEVLIAALPTDMDAERVKKYTDGGFTVVPIPNGLSELRKGYSRALEVLMAVVGVVLLIACSNVAQLLLARGAARSREIAIRVAVGADRARIVRQLFVECVSLSLVGAALGIAFAFWADRLLVELLSTRTNTVWLDLSIDAKVLGFSLFAAVGTAIVCGLFPAWKAARADVHAVIQAKDANVGGFAARPLGRTLVVGQVALSLVLLMTAGLLLGSFWRLARMQLGFEPRGVLVVTTGTDRAQLRPDGSSELQERLLAEIRAIPGVRSASASQYTPIGGRSSIAPVLVDGFVPKDRTDAVVSFNGIGRDYFKTLGIPVLAGREFDARDVAGGQRVAAVNMAFVRKFFGGLSAVGRSYRTQGLGGAGIPVEVVAVVADSRTVSVRDVPKPMVYVPMTQLDRRGASVSIEILSSIPAASLTSSIRDVFAHIDPQLSFDVTTLSNQVGATLGRPRLLASLSAFFGSVALLLAMIGLYGTIAYRVTCRRKELGIRMALGSSRGRVLRMVLGEATAIGIIGVAAGLGIAFVTTKFVASLLFEVQPRDATTFATCAVVLLLTSLMAGLIPAARAARTDPAMVLRED